MTFYSIKNKWAMYSWINISTLIHASIYLQNQHKWSMNKRKEKIKILLEPCGGEHTRAVRSCALVVVSFLFYRLFLFQIINLKQKLTKPIILPIGELRSAQMWSRWVIFLSRHDFKRHEIVEYSMLVVESLIIW